MSAHFILEPRAYPTGLRTSPKRQADAIAPSQSPAAQAGLAAGLLLALRFVQARFLSVWGLLVAVALCPAQVFADFALFSALASFVGLAAFLRFEAVFFQSGERSRLGRAFRLAVVAGTLFLLVALVTVMAGDAAGLVPTSYGALFMTSLAGRAVIRLVSSEATAEGDFAAIGNANLIQALVQPGVMVLLIWILGATSISLFAADAVGHLASAGFLVWRRRAALVRLVRGDLWSAAEIRETAIRWRAAPLLLLPSALLSFGFMIIPLIALPYASNPLLAAHVALAMRLLDVPTQMFAAVSVPLVLSRLRRQPASSRQAWVRFATLCLVAAALALFAAIAIAAVSFDVLLGGTQWAGVGQVVAIMALFYGGIALVMPLHEMAALSRHPRRQVATNGLALLAVALVMICSGALSLWLLAAIGFISVLRTLAHIQFAWTRLGIDGFARAPYAAGAI